MSLPAIERKALFKAQVTRDRTTLESAAKEVCGVTWYHLNEGLEGRRAIAAEVKEKFAHYIGYSAEYVFGSNADASAA